MSSRASAMPNVVKRRSTSARRPPASSHTRCAGATSAHELSGVQQIGSHPDRPHPAVRHRCRRVAIPPSSAALRAAGRGRRGAARDRAPARRPVRFQFVRRAADGQFVAKQIDLRQIKVGREPARQQTRAACDVGGDGRIAVTIAADPRSKADRRSGDRKTGPLASQRAVDTAQIRAAPRSTGSPRTR